MDINPLIIQFVLLMPYLLDSSYLDKTRKLPILRAVQVNLHFILL